MKNILISLLVSLALVSADITEDCGPSMEILVPLLVDIIKDAEEQNMEKLSTDSTKLLTDVTDIFGNCMEFLPSEECKAGLFEVGPNLFSIVSAYFGQDYPKFFSGLLGSLGGFFSAGSKCFQTGLPTRCSIAFHEFGEKISPVFEDIKSGSYLRLISDLTSAWPFFDNVSKVCNGYSVGGECEAALFGLAPVALSIERDANQGNLQKVLEDIGNGLPLYYNILTYCFEDPNTKQTEVLNKSPELVECLKEAGSSLLVLDKAANALVNADYTQTIVEIKNGALAFQQTASKCFSFSETCVEDILSRVLPIAEEAAKSFDENGFLDHKQTQKTIEDLMSASPTVLESIRQCRQGIEGQTFRRLAGRECLNAVIGCIPELEILLKDLLNGNWEQLLNDGLNYLPQIQQAAALCL